MLIFGVKKSSKPFNIMTKIHATDLCCEAQSGVEMHFVSVKVRHLFPCASPKKSQVGYVSIY